jgi:hypothetical protein
MATEPQQREQVDESKDFGQGDAATVRQWLARIERQEKKETDWRDQSREIIKIYRDNARKASYSGRNAGSKAGRVKFNILYSNTVTLAGGLYNQTPRPDVRRRNATEDPIANWAATALERGLAASLDGYDFDEVMAAVVHDYLLPGRGVPRVRYLPKFSEEAAGAEGEEAQPALETEALESEAVDWDQIVIGPARKWKKVPWIAFRHRMSREQLVERFGAELGKQVKLDWAPDDKEKSREEDVEDIFKTGEVWEIWSLASRKVLMIAPSVEAKPLEVIDDPLHLSGFFPIPRPLYSIRSNEDLIPTPEFHIYADQAYELDRVTKRISRLIEALKARGAYDGQLGTDLEKILSEDDNGLVPAENAAALADRGGLKAAIWFMPLQEIQAVLAGLYIQRDQIKQAIFEITGISDLFRGATKASESATAQSIKAQFGSLRFERRQREVQRLVRDVFRMKAEIMAEQFSVETLREIGQLPLLTAEEKTKLQQAASAAQAAGQEPQVPPEIMEAMQQPSLDDVVAFLRSQKARDFRIDVETDSTIAVDQAREREDVTLLLTSVTQFLQGMAPLIGQGAPPEFAISLLMVAVRRFRLGREVEDSLNALPRKLQPQGPSPKELELKAEAEEGEKDRQHTLALKKMELEHNGDMARQKRIQEQRVAGVMDEEEMEKIAMAIQQLAQSHAQVAAQGQQQMQMLLQAMTAQTQALSALARAQAAPKRIVTDPATGEPVGIETEMPTMQ